MDALMEAVVQFKYQNFAKGKERKKKILWSGKPSLILYRKHNMLCRYVTMVHVSHGTMWYVSLVIRYWSMEG